MPTASAGGAPTFCRTEPVPKAIAAQSAMRAPSIRDLHEDLRRRRKAVERGRVAQRVGAGGADVEAIASGKCLGQFGAVEHGVAAVARRPGHVEGGGGGALVVEARSPYWKQPASAGLQ